MRFSFGQELRQAQKQILSQRMIQSMEILQLPLQELEERIDMEMEKNPLLEMDEESGEDSATEGPQEADDTGFFEVEKEIVVGDSPNSQDDFRIADEFAATYSDTIDELPSRSQNWIEDEEGRRDDAFANIASHDQTLEEHLIEQLSWYDLEESVRWMAERIICNLDRNGFLPYDAAELLGPKAAQEDFLTFEEALLIVKELEPSGVGAKNVNECLLMQLRPGRPYYEELQVLIRSHLEDLEHNRLPYISKQTGFSIQLIGRALDELRKLNPRPGASFAYDPTPPIIPDVFIDKDEDGKYTARLEEGRLPSLRISRYYRELMKQRDTDKDTKEYIKQKVGSAQWLIDAIMQRRNTLLRVSQAIVDLQLDFFEFGPGSLKPLKMQQVADIVGVHVTTVSRACDEKWLQCSQGIFALKRFFTGGVSTTEEGEEEIAQDVVHQKLQELVNSENKEKPYSDEELVTLLEEGGVKVARRTIAKYRQALNIPSSRERRQWNVDD